jgi:hypothetical protein
MRLSPGCRQPYPQSSHSGELKLRSSLLDGVNRGPNSRNFQGLAGVLFGRVSTRTAARASCSKAGPRTALHQCLTCLDRNSIFLAEGHFPSIPGRPISWMELFVWSGAIFTGYSKPVDSDDIRS